MDTQTDLTKTLKEIWNSNPELRAEFNDDFQAYEAYEKNLKAGNIRILKKEKPS